MTRRARRDAIGALTCALTSPERPEEVTGLAPALEAFQQSAGTETGRRRFPMRTLRLRTALIALSAMALLAVGGTRAAQQGALPDPVQQAAHSVLGRIGVRTPEPSHGGKDRHPAKHQDPAKNGNTSATASPTPDPVTLLQLCQELASDGYDLHTKTMNPSARDRLANAAGDESRIVPYCVSLLTASGLPVGNPPSTPPGSTPTDRRPAPAPPRASVRATPTS
jgi:hypothetical protein